MNKTHELLAALDEEIETAPPSQLVAICGHLEALKVKAFARAMAPSPQPHSDDNNAEDRLLTVDEVAKRLGQKAQWVRDHQDKLNSRVTLPGRSVRFSEKRLNEFIRRRGYG
jgi:predicted DNA-binding transcriptional regulator AlpA